jgi:hypothetical protein
VPLPAVRPGALRILLTPRRKGRKVKFQGKTNLVFIVFVDFNFALFAPWREEKKEEING